MRSILRIAVVDDSSSVRMMVGICLEELGIDDDEIFEFPSPVVALMDFEKNYYDLIFCDLHMPEMNGDALVEEIFNYISHLKSSRIIMISGEEDPNYKTRLKKLNVHQFIKKPIQPSSFNHHVKPFIAKILRDKKPNN